MKDKAQKAWDELNKLTDKWTLDFSAEAFILYFSDKKWLVDKIIEEMYANNIFIKESPEWVSVSERFPDINQWVIAYNSFHHIKIYDNIFYDGDTHCYCPVGEIKNVTHWMPLPPPPLSKDVKVEWGGSVRCITSDGRMVNIADELNRIENE